MARLAHPAGSLGVGEHQLIDDDVVRVYLALGQLLDQPLRLIEGEELGDADAYERGLVLRGEPGRRSGAETLAVFNAPPQGSALLSHRYFTMEMWVK